MSHRIAHIKHAGELSAFTFLFFISYCLFSLSSCYTPRYVYSPSAQNVPLLTDKGDNKLGIVYSNNFPGSKEGESEKPYSQGLDVHAAYAFTSKFAVQASYFYRSEKNGDDQLYIDQPVIRYKRNLLELGAGLLQKVDERNNKIFQLFAGVGYGKFSFYDSGIDSLSNPYHRYHRSTILKFYVQPAFMFILKKRTALSVSSRFSVVNYLNVKTDYTNQELLNYELASLSGDPVIFWEPAFIHTIGFKKLPFRIEYQAGFSALVSRRFIDARSFNFSAGIQADMVKLLKRKQPLSVSK